MTKEQENNHTEYGLRPIHAGEKQQLSKPIEQDNFRIGLQQL